jgi:hypothetical protein
MDSEQRLQLLVIVVCGALIVLGVLGVEVAKWL